MSQINGHISQIIGPVIDVFFDTQGQEAEKVLPKIYEALKVTRSDGKEKTPCVASPWIQQTVWNVGLRLYRLAPRYKCRQATRFAVE